LYCEQPYCSLDGNRLALFRTRDACPATPGELLVYDIARYRVARLATEVSGIGAGMMAVANAAWSGVIYATSGRDESKRLLRFHLDALQAEDLFAWNSIPGAGLFTIRGDHKFGLTAARTGRHDSDGRPLFGVFCVNLDNGAYEEIHHSPDICNPHLQYQLGAGNRIMVQENRGCLVDDKGNVLRSCDARGVGLYSIEADGNDRRDFPVGPPYTPSTTGHECWIGESERALVTLSAVYHDGQRSGNVVEVSHDSPLPRVVFESPFIWNHISASRCGRYFVTDCYQQSGVPLLIGSIATGKTRVLCDSLTSGGGAQYSHAHPYLTSDNKYVVFNSDRTGLPQVYIASVPEEFLRSIK